MPGKHISKFDRASGTSFGVTKWTVTDCQSDGTTGSMELRTSTRGRKSKIEEHRSKKILEMLGGELTSISAKSAIGCI